MIEDTIKYYGTFKAQAHGKAEGITEVKTPYGNKVKVYNLEKTICDIIRNKKKIEIALFADSMKRYAERKDRNSIKLQKYAKLFNIEDEVRKYRDEQVNTHSSPKPKNVITMTIILPIA